MRKSSRFRGKQGLLGEDGLAVSVAAFPIPGRRHDVLDVVSSRPAKFALGLFVVGIDRHHIAGSTGSGDPIQFLIGCLFEGVNRFQHRDAITASEVDRFALMGC